MEQPFYIGQEVVALKDSVNTEGSKVFEGKTYIVQDIAQCKCGEWWVDVGSRSSYTADCECGSCLRIVRRKTKAIYGQAKYFAPIERAKTKYVVKEVEVAPTIRELEVCQS